MYQPTIARWVSVDLAYGMVFVDQYRYSMNMPLLLPDPNGNCPCCCCVDDIDYTTPKFGEYLPAGQERSGNAAAPFGRWPLQFQVVATMELTAGPGSPTCEMEWFECSDKGANRGQIGGQWSKFDMTTDGITSGVYGPDMPRCPGWFQQYIGDAPTLDEKLEAVTRINFFVRARSSDGCDCSANEVSVAFNLVVKTVKIDFNNPGAPPKFEPNPPVLKRGLDPTILGCGVPPGVV